MLCDSTCSDNRGQSRMTRRDPITIDYHIVTIWLPQFPQISLQVSIDFPPSDNMMMRSVTLMGLVVARSLAHSSGPPSTACSSITPGSKVLNLKVKMLKFIVCKF